MLICLLLIEAFLINRNNKKRECSELTDFIILSGFILKIKMLSLKLINGTRVF